MVPRKKKKLFVLDTNIILHDSNSLYTFQKNDVIIPITVIEELDKFKKGNESINLHSRRFIRALDKLSDDKLFNQGVKIRQDLGKVMIKLEPKFHRDLITSFDQDKPDHRILNIAYTLKQESRRHEVILVSKDVNLRMKAKAVGLIAEDYKTDQVTHIDELYKGYCFQENVSKHIIKKLTHEPFEIHKSAIKSTEKLFPNEYLVLRNESHSVLGFLDSEDNKIKKIQKESAHGIQPRNAEQAFALHALINPKIRLVTITGKAGTGKTLLALAAALECRAVYNEILLARPVVPLSNRDIGYLPGSVTDKLNPYMQPLFDNLGVTQKKTIDSNVKAKKLSKILEEENIVIAPLAFIRGRSLVDVYFIIDEAQNLTPHEIKTIITRAGENTKLIFTGDIFQIDHPYLDTFSNGLSHLIDKMQGQKLYTHINLQKGERSELAEIASNIL